MLVIAVSGCASKSGRIPESGMPENGIAKDRSAKDRQAVTDAKTRTDLAGLSVHSHVGIGAFGCGMIPRVGAGVTVGKRLVLTDAHVVAGASSLELSADDSIVKGTLVHLDPNLDLALIQVDRNFPWPIKRGVPFGKARKADQGWVTLVRNDQLRAVPVRILRPVIITTEDIYVKGSVTRAGYEIQASTRPGDSGAAVMVGGKIVGLLWSRSQLTNQRAWLTDTASVVRLIDSPKRWRIPKDTRCR
jgi:S1-C subfamily serine protease